MAWSLIGDVQYGQGRVSGAFSTSSGFCSLFMNRISMKTAKATGHKLVLTGLSSSVHEVFDISGFTAIFTIEPDVAAGLAAVG